MSNITTRKYLDYTGLSYLTQNYVISKKIGTAAGDMLYVSSITSGQPPVWGRVAAPSYSAEGAVYMLTLDNTTQAMQPTWLTISQVISNNNLIVNPMTSQDDIIIGGTSGAPTRLAKGSNGQVLKINNSGHIAWATDEGLTNPMTTQYDIIYGGASGTPTRLGKGANYSFLGIASNGTLGYRQLVNLEFNVMNDALGVFSPSGYNPGEFDLITSITFDDENSFDVSVSSGVLTLSLISSVVQSCTISGSSNPSVSNNVLTLPDIQSIPNTGTDSIDSLFS